MRPPGQLAALVAEERAHRRRDTRAARPAGRSPRTPLARRPRRRSSPGCIPPPGGRQSLGRELRLADERERPVDGFAGGASGADDEERHVVEAASGCASRPPTRGRRSRLPTQLHRLAEALADRREQRLVDVQLEPPQQVEELRRVEPTTMSAARRAGRATPRGDRDPDRQLEPVEGAEGVEIGRVVTGCERPVAGRLPRAGDRTAVPLFESIGGSTSRILRPKRATSPCRARRLRDLLQLAHRRLLVGPAAEVERDAEAPSARSGRAAREPPRRKRRSSRASAPPRVASSSPCEPT